MIGLQIKTLRKGENLTQKEFAKRLLISQSYLSGIENGNEEPTDKLLKLICLEFGVNENWLLKNSGEIYTEIYGNDKGNMATLSNKALLNIMELLSTESNVEYGHYAILLNEMTTVLNPYMFFDSEYKLNYLQSIQDFMEHLARTLRMLSDKKNEHLTGELVSTLVNDLSKLIVITKSNSPM